jgi:LPXTG-motif cell wall-anchored protein
VITPSPTHLRQVAVVAGAALGTVPLTATAASAHVEATADGAQAGAGPVTVTFDIAAESDTAGITGVKTQLPTGIAPSAASLAAGPAGWVLTPTSDGYEVAGPALETGVDAKLSVAITQLPSDAAAELPFKTLVRYSDNSEDAWIELPTTDNPDPANPAPAITVAPAAAPATTSAATSAAPSPTSASPTIESPASETPAAAGTAAAATTDDGSSSTGLVIGGLAVIAAVAGVLLWLRRRRSSAA